MNKILLFTIILALAGCDIFQKSLLDRVEKIAEEKQKCMVNQVLENDCKYIEKKLKILKLELEKSDNPPSKKQTRAAYKLGALKVQGDVEKSIYNQVKNSLRLLPDILGYNPVELTDINFLIFTKTCGKFDKAMFYQRFTTRYVGEKAILFFHKVSGSCFSVSDLQENFCILEEEQVDKLKREDVEVLKFENWDEANQASEEYKTNPK